MARRSDHTREELKNLAVQAGYTLLKEEGLAEFSARKVAREIGYTVGTLYNVFGTYEIFMLHIQAAILDDWFADLESAMKHNQDTHPLHALAAAYIAYAKKNYSTWSVLFTRTSIPKEESPDWYKQKLDQFFALVEQVVLPIVGNDTVEAQKSARLLWASIHGICVLTLSGKLDLLADEVPEKMSRDLIDTYLKGLTKHD